MPTTKKGGTSLVTPPDLTSLAVPFGLMLAKQSAEHMIAKTASARPKSAPKSSSGKKSGGASTPAISELAVPFGLMIAKSGAERLMSKKGGAAKTTGGMKKDMSCGVNPSTGRCKKGMPKDKDMCDLNKKTNRCVKDKYTEGDMYNKVFKGGMKKDMSCGVNPSTGRCKKGMPKDKDMCDLNKKTNRCVKDKYTEGDMYRKVLGTKKPRANKKGGSSCGDHSNKKGGSSCGNHPLTPLSKS